MTLLAELFELLENEPAPSGNDHEQAGIPTTSANGMKVATLAPASNGYRPATGSRQAPAAAPAATSAPVAPQNAPAQNVAQTEGAPAVRRNAWTITRGGRPICTICGAPMTRTEAMAEARWRWPDAEIE